MECECVDEVLCPSTAGVTGQKCGNPLQRHQKFCSECGCKVELSWFLQQTSSSQMDICTGTDEDGNVCGQQLDSSVKFCPNCGARSKLNRSISSRSRINFVAYAFVRVPKSCHPQYSEIPVFFKVNEHIQYRFLFSDIQTPTHHII